MPPTAFAAAERVSHDFDLKNGMTRVSRLKSSSGCCFWTSASCCAAVLRISGVWPVSSRLGVRSVRGLQGGCKALYGKVQGWACCGSSTYITNRSSLVRARDASVKHLKRVATRQGRSHFGVDCLPGCRHRVPRTSCLCDRTTSRTRARSYQEAESDIKAEAGKSRITPKNMKQRNSSRS